MKKFLIYPILALILAVGVNIQTASATLFLSGDSNIIFEGINKDDGNKLFFKNVLQDGTEVVVLDNLTYPYKQGPYYEDFWATINNFYDNLSDVTSNLIRDTFTSDQLANVNLFVAPLPERAFTPDEISALQGLLARGGSVFFLGENKETAFSGYNSNINLALAALGSGMSIVTDGDFFDDKKGGVYPVAKDSQIASDLFTNGVTSFTYASPSEVSVGERGKAIFFGSEGQPFVAYEVPLPASAWLLGSGLLGLGFFRRKGRK